MEDANMMRSYSALVLALSGALALSACNKKEETPAPMETTPPATEPAPAPLETTPPTPVTTPAAQPVSVTAINLGNAVDASQNVSTPSTTFASTDTIYASVSTAGTAASATLTAKWTYQDGQTVNESSQTIAPNGPAVTSFHISKPDGWPAGSYKVEIMLDGRSVATKDFTVQ
jgi:hypothetical protein